jgi:vacuolar-type H+-ATPase subunit H
MTLRRQRPVEGREEERQDEQLGPGEEWPGMSETDAVPSLGALRVVEPEAPAPSPSITSVGEHVASVLAAAEAAAEKLRLDAEEDARLTRRRLEKEADDLRTRIVAETEAQSSEILQRAIAAEEHANALRANAETTAERRLREADETAARIVGEAEQRAAEIEHVAAERHTVLLSDIASSESRMTNLAETLHTVASQLEGVAADRLPIHGADADSPLKAEAQAVPR